MVTARKAGRPGGGRSHLGLGHGCGGCGSDGGICTADQHLLLLTVPVYFTPLYIFLPLLHSPPPSTPSTMHSGTPRQRLTSSVGQVVVLAVGRLGNLLRKTGGHKLVLCGEQRRVGQQGGRRAGAGHCAASSPLHAAHVSRKAAAGCLAAPRSCSCHRSMPQHGWARRGGMLTWHADMRHAGVACRRVKGAHLCRSPAAAAPPTPAAWPCPAPRPSARPAVQRCGGIAGRLCRYLAAAAVE